MDDLAPEIFTEPIQTKIDFADTIHWEEKGYSYDITPVYNYTIAGLIVAKNDVFWSDSAAPIAPVDLALIWGDNAKSESYRNLNFTSVLRSAGPDDSWEKLKNSQFAYNQFSHNHLIILQPDLKHKAKILEPGDQVQIKGKLVNCVVYFSSRPEYKSSWNSSATRDDLDCEIILVDDIAILKMANHAYRILMKASFIGIIVCFMYQFYEGHKKEWWASP